MGSQLSVTDQHHLPDEHDGREPVARVYAHASAISKNELEECMQYAKDNPDPG